VTPQLAASVISLQSEKEEGRRSEPDTFDERLSAEKALNRDKRGER